jgi:hypothetical protein
LAAAAGLAASATAQAQIVNGDFETGDLTGWTVYGTNPTPTVSSTVAYTGTHSLFLGSSSGAEPLGDGAVYQGFTPLAGQHLMFYYQTSTTDTITFDWQDAYIQNSSGTILSTIFHQCTTNSSWTPVDVDLTPWVGQSIRVAFLVHQDGFGDLTSMNVDAVVVGAPPPPSACCLPDGTCSLLSQAACGAIGGAIFHSGAACGAGICPPTGACCLSNAVCNLLTSAGCGAAGGIYRGDNVTCANANCPAASVGPDVIVGEIQESGGCCPNSEGTTISPSATVGTVVAYGLGTSSCNIGTLNVSWVSGTPFHPIIPQNMYRLETVNGSTHFEQIGQSWSKYAFAALTYYVCSPNGTNTCSGQGGSVLGVGCSDPYTAGRNATQTSAGPRYQCNPFTGDFPDTAAIRNAWPPVIDATSRRIRVQAADISAATHPAALYFGECMYVTKDDATYGNQKNNSSYRRFTIGASNVVTLQGAIGGAGTHRMQPAIYAWKANGLGTDVSDPNVMISDVAPPQTFNPPNGTPTGDGWVYVGSRATDLGNGMWHYEYAVENQNSNRGIGSVTINYPPGTQITNAAWKQIDAHSGVAAEDATRNAVWIQTIGSSSINWASPNSYSAASPTLGSYIRWGTLYNFRFDANVAPINTGQATLGYYIPDASGPPAIAATAWVPGVNTCYANCDNSTAPPILNINDFQCFLNRYAAGDSYANCDNSTTPPVLNALDFQCFITAFSAGCS